MNENYKYNKEGSSLPYTLNEMYFLTRNYNDEIKNDFYTRWVLSYKNYYKHYPIIELVIMIKSTGFKFFDEETIRYILEFNDAKPLLNRKKISWNDDELNKIFSSRKDIKKYKQTTTAVIVNKKRKLNNIENVKNYINKNKVCSIKDIIIDLGLSRNTIYKIVKDNDLTIYTHNQVLSYKRMRAYINFNNDRIIEKDEIKTKLKINNLIINLFYDDFYKKEEKNMKTTTIKSRVIKEVDKVLKQNKVYYTDSEFHWFDYEIVYEALLEKRKMKIKKIIKKIEKNNL